MTDNSLRHTIAFLITFMAILAWAAGFLSGAYGWWWTVLGVFIVYILVYKTITKD